ncbi:hypothetical protein I4F81_003831 [Pyropia yezoensis]|uniref:Uncharacterized protein n=1 Tax=Pyropia yezoensis TaxID=2788 RepID=A0ACC3BTQ8_PYRYE|nr:hypothetical protein I4F81_003831 [Neopyropia yezoensis]
MVAYNPPGTLADVHAYVTGVTAAATQAPSTLRLHVTHANMAGTTFAERFVLTDAAYAARPDSVRAVKARMRAAEAAAAAAAGREPPPADGAWSATRAARDRRLAAAGGVDMEPVTGVAVGDRVEVAPGGKRGVVAWVGADVGGGVPPGWWVGVTYDEPVGRNDGRVGGVRLWSCEAGHGGLVRARNVAVGDFPPRDDLEGSDLGDDEV